MRKVCMRNEIHILLSRNKSYTLIQYDNYYFDPPTLFGKKQRSNSSYFGSRFLEDQEIFLFQTKTQQNFIFFSSRNAKNEVSRSRYEKPVSLPTCRCWILGGLENQGYREISGQFFLSDTYRRDYGELEFHIGWRTSLQYDIGEKIKNLDNKI